MNDGGGGGGGGEPSISLSPEADAIHASCVPVFETANSISDLSSLKWPRLAGIGQESC